MTTVRGSAVIRSSRKRSSPILAFSRAAHALRAEFDVGSAVGKRVLPRGPLADRVRAFGPVLLVVALRVKHFRLRVRPWARDRRGEATCLDGPEPTAVGE